MRQAKLKCRKLKSRISISAFLFSAFQRLPFCAASSPIFRLSRLAFFQVFHVFHVFNG